MEEHISYREIIATKGFYIGTPVGNSMYPMLRNRLDTVKLVAPKGRCKKYDCILYQRDTGKYVLHRIVKVKKNSYVLCGDNQYIKEKGILDRMIVGLVVGFYKDEKYIEVTDQNYIKYYKKRVRSLPFRYFIGMMTKVLNKVFKRDK